MIDLKLNDISSVSIDELVETLSNSYAKLINQGKKISLFPSVMLWGQPGVGKSQAIRQIGEELTVLTNKKVNIVDVRLLLFNPIDLRGLPVANEDKTLAVWLKPKIFQMDSSNQIINILFLDEISAAPQSVQAAAYQITLDRTVGEHKLPDNCIVIAAGNRVTDKSVAYKMPKALANRLLHFEIETDYENWKRWAIKHDIHPSVIGFLNFKQNCINTFDPSKDNLAFATPRSWEMVSNILNNIDEDIDKVYNLICGLVGSGVAIEFRTWSKIYQNLPNIEDIFNGKQVPIPKDPSTLYALCSAITSYAKKHKDDIVSISHAIQYAYNFPKDFAVMLVEDLMSIDKNFQMKLLSIPEFGRWVSKNVTVLNGHLNGNIKR